MSMQNVWVYQADRILSSEESSYVLNNTNEFLHQWMAHGKQLSADARIENNLFLIIELDVSVEAASGCSIDACINFVKELEKDMDFTFFNRNRIAWLENDLIRDSSIEEFQELYKKGNVADDQLVINTLVTNSNELANNWKLPLNQSWHSRLL